MNKKKERLASNREYSSYFNCEMQFITKFGLLSIDNNPNLVI